MKREIEIGAAEARVFGVLVEKSLTTPEQYPLTLNSATTGSNQKSNRQPVVEFDEMVVSNALDRLEEKYLVRRVYPGNSRVEKYCHNGKDALGLDTPVLAVLAELLLRGPQTAGELRAHAGRMTNLASLEDLMQILERLIELDFVERLAPLPGSRAERFVQKFSPGLHPVEPGAAAPVRFVAGPATAELAERVERLEAEVARLREIIDRLL
jgi:uncharacterized protein YceH (UPF0502 family)